MMPDDERSMTPTRTLYLGMTLLTAIGLLVSLTPTVAADHNGECGKHDGFFYVCDELPPCVEGVDTPCGDVEVIGWAPSPTGHCEGVNDVLNKAQCNDPGVYVIHDRAVLGVEALSPGHDTASYVANWDL